MLSVMANTPDWEQQIRAYNAGGGHASHLGEHQWVGEQKLDSIGLGDFGLGDGPAQDGWQFAQNLVNTGLQTWQTIEQQKQAAKAQRMGRAPKAPITQSGGGGGILDNENTKWLLIAGAVIVGGIILFSVTKKRKKED